MRIAMVTNNYTPYSGGVVSAIRATVDQLMRMGHEVVVVTFDFAPQTDDPIWVHRLWSPVKFVYKSNYIALAWRPKAQITSFFKQFKPDIVHVHHPFLLGSIAAKVAYTMNIPVVFTYHTHYHEMAQYVPCVGFLVRWIVLLLVRAFFARVQGIIVPNETVAALLPAAPRSIAVIASGLQRDFIMAQQVSDCPHAGPIRLLVVSRLVQEKNIEAVLRVARLLTQRGVVYQLQIVGYGYAYEQLRRYAFNRLKLSPKQVCFIHKPERSVLLQAYKEADVFLFSSHIDTQGLVLAEAMATSTTVVALEGIGQRHIVQSGVNGFIVPNEEMMAAAIARLEADRPYLEQLKEAAYASSVMYRPEQVVSNLCAFYEQVIG